MSRRWSHLAAGLVLMAAVSAAMAGVDVSYSQKVDFSRLKTYAWSKGTEAPNLLTEKRIHTAVEEQLNARGLARVEESPDIYVVTHTAGSSSTKLDVNGFGYAGYGWTGQQHFVPALVTQRESYRGTLIVDLLDASGKELIWRGSAEGSLGIDPNPEKVGKKVFKVVKEMFKDFPPQPGKKQ